MTHPLKAFRNAKQISLDELAKAVGVSKGSLSRIENGKQEPSLRLIGRLSDATEGAVTANDFMRSEDRARIIREAVQ